MPSSAYTRFRSNTIKQVSDLIAIFTERNTGRGRNTNHELLYGALTILIAGWELYCEDVVLEYAGKISNKSFDLIENSAKVAFINKVHNSDYKKPLESKLLKVIMDWKIEFLVHVKEEVSGLNTPKFKNGDRRNLNDIFNLVINGKMSTMLNDRVMDNYSTKLDDIVTIRGSIAHTGEPSQPVNSEVMNMYVNYIQSAAANIEIVLYEKHQQIYGVTPWQNTRLISDYISLAR